MGKYVILEGHFYSSKDSQNNVSEIGIRDNLRQLVSIKKEDNHYIMVIDESIDGETIIDTTK